MFPQFNMASPGRNTLCTRFAVGLMISWVTLTAMEDLQLAGVVKEYCRGEPFQAECGPDEVVLMTSALHGRMKLGRCIRRDEQLGCQEDALIQMDSYCSGRELCYKEKITGLLEIPQCIGELASHMDASYTCLKVLPSQTSCKIETSGEPILANTVLESGGCGSPAKPWVLEVHSSQRVNITLWDMGVYTIMKKNRGKEVNCFSYGSIHEVNFGQEHTICGGKDRISNLMMSHSNKIEIYMSPPSEIGDVHFLLAFEVLGCEDFSLPSDMWLKRGSGHVIVGCYSSRDTWRLDCVDDQWQGAIGNCTKAVRTTPRITFIESPEPVEEMDMVEFSNEIGIASAVVTAVFLSILLLVIGLLYDRRHNAQMERDIIQVHVSEEFSWSAANKKQISQQNGQTNTLCKEEVTPGGKTQNYQRVSEWCDGQRPPSHVDHIYDTPSYFDLDPDYMRQSNNGQFSTLANRDSYLQPGDGQLSVNNQNTLANRDSYLQPTDNL